MDYNYNNYFYYKMIDNCYKYMNRKYNINNQILIEYKNESYESYIRIFGYYFVKNNKGRCFMRI